MDCFVHLESLPKLIILFRLSLMGSPASALGEGVKYPARGKRDCATSRVLDTNGCCSRPPKPRVLMRVVPDS